MDRIDLQGEMDEIFVAFMAYDLRVELTEQEIEVSPYLSSLLRIWKENPHMISMKENAIEITLPTHIGRNHWNHYIHYLKTGTLDPIPERCIAILQFMGHDIPDLKFPTEYIEAHFKDEWGLNKGLKGLVQVNVIYDNLRPRGYKHTCDTGNPIQFIRSIPLESERSILFHGKVYMTHKACYIHRYNML